MRGVRKGRTWMVMIGILATHYGCAESQELNVDAFREALMMAYDGRDLDALAALHASDVSVVNSRGESIEGREAWTAYWRDRWEGATGPNPLQYSPAEVREVGPYVMERGEYGPRGAPPVGRYVWLLAAQPSNEGGWEIQWFIYSS